jgi:NADH dehydrogenase/NADH:ubiquinone oxidoreductase subunit G
MPGLSRLLQAVSKGTKVAVHATTDSPMFEVVEYVLPNVSSYEKSGTLVSALGRLQKLNGAIPWQYTARDGHAVVFGLEKGHDREKPAANRAQQYFEHIVVEKILLSKDTKWRGFNPFGVNVVEAAQ